MHFFLRRAVATAVLLLPTAALAHPGHGNAVGFMHGFLHPLGGVDHILAMVTVGMFAWQLGGRAIWLVPATFVALMAAGGTLGIAGVPLPWVEIGIAVSVIALGAVVALNVQAPAAVAMAMVGLFAIFHGHAHGAEMPLDAAGLDYGLGFVTATALLHVAGIGGGALMGRIAGATVTRLAGGAVALAGIALLVQAF